MRIFIIGFMGAGKTTIGKRLAKELNLHFYDLDTEIENKYKMSVQSIFNKFGEVQFRQLEMLTLQKILNFDNYVMSCGGGTPCFYSNMKFINQSGTSIYIKLPPKTLADRIEASQKKRPLTNGKNKEELLYFIHQTLEQREDFYNQAKIIVNGINLNIKQLVEKIKTNIPME